MDFDSPDVMKDFPGLYASELNKQCNNDSDYSDENDKVLKKDGILIGKRKDKKDKDKGYAALEGESSADENFKSRSPSKSKKAKSFKFSTKVKEKRDKSRDKDKELERKKEREKKNEKKSEKEKVKSEKTKKIESADISDVLPIFGVTLDLAIERSRCHDGVDIPLPIRNCIDQIELAGLNFECIYKVSGPKSKVFHIRKLYNQRANVNLSDYDIPTITSLLKGFLRDLPESIFTNDLLIRFEEAGAILNLNTREKHLKILVDNLPCLNKLLLSWLMIHLHNVSLNEKANKMNKQTLSAALNHTFHCSSRLLHALLHHAQQLFPNIKIERYIPPLESGAKLPDDPFEIEVELHKQESLLNQIHKEMNEGCISKQREELLWEVQRIITQLKRKLKSANKDKDVPSSELAKEVVKMQETHVQAEEKEADVEEVNAKNVVYEPSVDLTDHIATNDTRDEVSNIQGDDIKCSDEINSDEEKCELISDKMDNTLAIMQNKNEGLHQLRETLLKNIQIERNEILLLKSKLTASNLMPGQQQPPPNIILNDNLNEIMDLFVKENQILQIKKINLVRQIIEEQEMCIELKAQISSKS